MRVVHSELRGQLRSKLYRQLYSLLGSALPAQLAGEQSRYRIGRQFSPPDRPALLLALLTWLAALLSPADYG